MDAPTSVIARMSWNRRRSTVSTWRNVTESPPSAAVSTGRSGGSGGPGSTRLDGGHGRHRLPNCVRLTRSMSRPERRDRADDAERRDQNVLEERLPAIHDDLVARRAPARCPASSCVRDRSRLTRAVPAARSARAQDANPVAGADLGGAAGAGHAPRRSCVSGRAAKTSGRVDLTRDRDADQRLHHELRDSPRTAQRNVRRLPSAVANGKPATFTDRNRGWVMVPSGATTKSPLNSGLRHTTMRTESPASARPALLRTAAEPQPGGQRQTSRT